MQKWEYLVVVRTYNSRWKRFVWGDETYKEKGGMEVLAELGQQGWELTVTHVLQESVEAQNLHYIFKRPA